MEIEQGRGRRERQLEKPAVSGRSPKAMRPSPGQLEIISRAKTQQCASLPFPNLHFFSPLARRITIRATAGRRRRTLLKPPRPRQSRSRWTPGQTAQQARPQMTPLTATATATWLPTRTSGWLPWESTCHFWTPTRLISSTPFLPVRLDSPGRRLNVEARRLGGHPFPPPFQTRRVH